MSIVLTGGAGFIGSAFLSLLNENGVNDIIVVDNLSCLDKKENLKNKRYLTYYDKNEFLPILPFLKGVTAIIHLGACSSTTETNYDYLMKNNVEYSKTLYNYAVSKNISFIYASSAATYGDGSLGFSDDISPAKLKPLNYYGESKNLFDKFVLEQIKKPKQVVGLKFFNVYGPNEYHKTGMYSMVYQGYNQAINNGEIKLFKSTALNIANGEQKRDFVYVKDVCSVIYFMLNNVNVNGIFNVGTGFAYSFNELATAVFNALNKPVKINYIDMPNKLSKQYQYYTVADISKLKSVGYDKQFHTINEGVYDYVINYLIPKKRR